MNGTKPQNLFIFHPRDNLLVASVGLRLQGTRSEKYIVQCESLLVYVANDQIRKDCTMDS